MIILYDAIPIGNSVSLRQHVAVFQPIATLQETLFSLYTHWKKTKTCSLKMIAAY